jgi:hypothetical protein
MEGFKKYLGKSSLLHCFLHLVCAVCVLFFFDVNYLLGPGMNNLRLLLILVGVYIIHLFLKFSDISVPTWMSSYLADLLCLPIMFGLFTWLMRDVMKRSSFRLTALMIVFGVCYVSFAFEWLAPRWSSRYTADGWDVVCYFVGGIFYLLFHQWEHKRLFT